MAGVEFRLRELAWLQSKDASSGRNRPKPPNPPKYAHQIASEGDETLRKADAYRERQKRL